MKPRTVLHLIHTGGAGGAETIFSQLVARLDPAEWRSVACAPSGGWLWSSLQKLPVRGVEMPDSSPFDIGLVRLLVRLIHTHQVRVLHTHLFGPAVYGNIAGRLAGVPVVSTIHGSVDLAGAQRWFGLKKRILRRPDNLYVAVTEALRQQVIDELGLPPGRTRVVTNGIDLSTFRPGRDRGLREELGWGSDEIVIGAVGNVRYPKGYDVLLEAAEIVGRSCSRCRFVVAGDTDGEPELRDELLARRRDLGLEERFVFAGFQDNIERVLNNFDVYALSSHREGLPLAILQAMATGLPIVATECGGPQEVLLHDRNALLVPVGNAPALAEAILALVRDRDRRTRLGDAALTTVKSKYGVDRMIRDYEALYRECLGDSTAPTLHGEASPP